MSERARARMAANPDFADGVPHSMLADQGDPGVVRVWCTECGLPDAPTGGWLEPTPPCPRCGSTWRWRGRISDLDGTATGAPDDGTCRDCYEWRRYPNGQEHFGWIWWATCEGRWGGCGHEHHNGEIALATA